MKLGVVGIRRCPNPAGDAPDVVDDQAQLTADDPAVIREALAADLLGTSPLPDGMDQLNAETVNDPKQRGLCQKVKGPGVMGFEQPKQAGALRQSCISQR